RRPLLRRRWDEAGETQRPFLLGQDVQAAVEGQRWAEEVAAFQFGAVALATEFPGHFPRPEVDGDELAPVGGFGERAEGGRLGLPAAVVPDLGVRRDGEVVHVIEVTAVGA